MEARLANLADNFCPLFHFSVKDNEVKLDAKCKNWILWSYPFFNSVQCMWRVDFQHVLIAFNSLLINLLSLPKSFHHIWSEFINVIKCCALSLIFERQLSKSIWNLGEIAKCLRFKWITFAFDSTITVLWSHLREAWDGAYTCWSQVRLTKDPHNGEIVWKTLAYEWQISFLRNIPWLSGVFSTCLMSLVFGTSQATEYLSLVKPSVTH